HRDRYTMCGHSGFRADRSPEPSGVSQMKMLKRAGMAIVLAAGVVGVAEAHHAVNSQFDANKTAPFTGVLEKTFIGNPHSYLYFVRTMPDGQMQHWTFETDAVVALKRAGLSVRDN